MNTDALLSRIRNLHAHAPDVARYEPEGITRIRQDVTQIIDEVSAVLEAHSSHTQLVPIMREHHVDALCRVIALSRDLECLIEDETMPTESVEWHVSFVIGIVASMVVDLLFRLLETYAELAANLDGSRRGFLQAPNLIEDCCLLVGLDDEEQQPLRQIAGALRSCTTTQLDA